MEDPFTKREDDVRRTSWTRERSHSFWIPEDRSYRRTFPAISYSRTLEKARRTDMKKGLLLFKDLDDSRHLFLGCNY